MSRAFYPLSICDGSTSLSGRVEELSGLSQEYCTKCVFKCVEGCNNLVPCCCGADCSSYSLQLPPDSEENWMFQDDFSARKTQKGCRWPIDDASPSTFKMGATHLRICEADTPTRPSTRRSTRLNSPARSRPASPAHSEGSPWSVRPESSSIPLTPESSDSSAGGQAFPSIPHVPSPVTTPASVRSGPESPFFLNSTTPEPLDLKFPEPLSPGSHLYPDNFHYSAFHHYQNVVLKDAYRKAIADISFEDLPKYMS